MPSAADVTERIEDAFEDIVKFMRDATHTYMGMGTVVQRRLINRDATDKLTMESFLQEAKAKGETLETEIRDRIEPIAKRVADRIEPITQRVEANLPAQVKDGPRDGPRARSHPARRLIQRTRTTDRASGPATRPGPALVAVFGPDASRTRQHVSDDRIVLAASGREADDEVEGITAPRSTSRTGTPPRQTGG